MTRLQALTGLAFALGLLAWAAQPSLGKNEWRVKFTITLDKTDYLEGETIAFMSTATNVSDSPIRFMGIFPAPQRESECYIIAQSTDGRIYAAVTPFRTLPPGDHSERLEPQDSMVLAYPLYDFQQVTAEGKTVRVRSPQGRGYEPAHWAPLLPGSYTMSATSTQCLTVPLGTVVTEKVIGGVLYSNAVKFVVHPKGTKLQPVLAASVAGKPLSHDQKAYRFLEETYIPATALAPLQVKIEIQNQTHQVKLTCGAAEVTLRMNRWIKAKPGQPEVFPYLSGYVPVCKVAPALGLRCDWNAKTKTLNITAAPA